MLTILTTLRKRAGRLLKPNPNIPWDVERQSQQGYDIYLNNLQANCQPKSLSDFPGGYPQLAAFLNFDPDFLIFRDFSRLQTRSLLQWQDELGKMEDDLDRLDARETNPRALRDVGEDGSKRRKEIIEEFRWKMKEYFGELERLRALQRYNRARPQDITNFFTWSYNNASYLEVQEARLFENANEFVSLSDHGQREPMDEIITRILRHSPHWLQQLFISPEDRRMVLDSFLTIFSRPRVRAASRMLFACFVVALAVLSIVVLSKLNGPKTRVIAIVFLIFTFCPVATIFTNASAIELLVATVTYSTVLVVFLESRGNDIS